jgi:hypothetical protein
MVNFTTYGMAGIGIAAAIGFVFALSLLSNNNTLTAGPDSTQQPSVPQPLSTFQQKSQPPGEEENARNNAPMSEQGTSTKMQAAINNESNADNQSLEAKMAWMKMLSATTAVLQRAQIFRWNFTGNLIELGNLQFLYFQ